MATKSESTLTVTLVRITGADTTPETYSLLGGVITADILYNPQVRPRKKLEFQLALRTSTEAFSCPPDKHRGVFWTVSRPKIFEDSSIVVRRPYERFHSFYDFSEDKRNLSKTSKEVSKMYELTHETEYVDIPILRCARFFLGTKTWGRRPPPPPPPPLRRLWSSCQILLALRSSMLALVYFFYDGFGRRLALPTSYLPGRKINLSRTTGGHLFSSPERDRVVVS